MDVDNPREEIVFLGQWGEFSKVLQKNFHKEEHNTQKGNTTKTDGTKKHLTLFPKIYISLCNVPTFGHHHSAEIHDDQSSQMDVISSTGVFERHCGFQLAFIIIFNHYETFCTGWL